MKRQAPPLSRPQKQGRTILPMTWRTLKSAPGTPMPSHGDNSGIVVLLLVRVVRHALHPLQPDPICDNLDLGLVVARREADAKGRDRPLDLVIAMRIQAVNHEERFPANLAIVGIRGRYRLVVGCCGGLGSGLLFLGQSKLLVPARGHAALVQPPGGALPITDNAGLAVQAMQLLVCTTRRDQQYIADGMLIGKSAQIGNDVRLAIGELLVRL